MTEKKKKVAPKKKVVPKKKPVIDIPDLDSISDLPEEAVTKIKEEVGAIAILCHFRTGSVLLRKVLVACGMVDCYEKLGFKHGDINGVGNALFHNYIKTPGSAVVEALTYFREEAIKRKWKHYGIKVDHVLQATCWEGVGKPFLEHWPDARYVVSIRHPAGIVKSFEKIRRDTPKQDPGFTDQQIVDSWLSTYEATKFLIEEKEARVVVYPDFYFDGIKDVVIGLGLEWTKEAEDLLDEDVFAKSAVTIAEIEKFEKKYPEASEMFQELLKYA